MKLIHKKGTANIVFVVANLPMWRAQGLYDLLKQDKRFHLNILMAGFKSYSPKENENNISMMREYFSERSMECITLKDLDSKSGLKQLNPDIIFYPQPYDGIFPLNIDCKSFSNRLTVFIPYGFMTVFKDWNYNSYLHNIAWRVYYPTTIHKKNAQNLAACRGDNVRVVGEPHADDFIYGIKHESQWKGDNSKKKIIWAPHFQINPNDMFCRPSFLWSYDVMVDIANSYKEKIQFAFKPHPRLFSELCNHPDWGEKKAREYYNLWSNMTNTQFENGEFIELFKESDALIHDCGSFVAEYMFTCKPCLFLTHDEFAVEQDLCDFGKKCFHLHDIGHNKEDIISFIEETVLNEKDIKYAKRRNFFEHYLMPPNGVTASENMYRDLTNSLFGNV